MSLKEVNSIAVFCGSSLGANSIYEIEARELAKVFVEQNIRLVYGGGSVGIMGILAKDILENGGKVIGVVPEPMLEKSGEQVCETVVVPDMHSRKKRMSEEGDAFIVLPGGYGTMEEKMEIITWSQLNIHSKPIILLNINGFFNLFVDWIKLAVKEQFIQPKNLNIFVVCDTAKDVVNALKSYEAPDTRCDYDWSNKERESLV